MAKIRCFAVIGSGFGDEGKGLITDYLHRHFHKNGDETLNIRYNGGAQAGHTVETKTHRHVFGHVGAGSFAGSNTYLSSAFISNPFALFTELNKLNNLGIRADITVNPNSRITTIYDMVINQIMELSRGGNRHGSCGMGINETVNRNLENGYSLNFQDLDKDDLSDRIKRIHDRFDQRVRPLIDKIHELYPSNIDSPELMELDKILRFCNIEECISSIRNAPSLFNHIGKPDIKDKVLILEGAQGLELDEELGIMPHLTRSVVGLKAALQAVTELADPDDSIYITPIYVTRTFKTRHGAGPLAHENVEFATNRIIDRTNTTGAWQGNFRYAPLDISILTKYIDMDISRALSSWLEKLDFHKINIVSPTIAITHMDLFNNNDDVTIFNQFGEETVVNQESFFNRMGREFKIGFISDGPTADHITEVEGI